MSVYPHGNQWLYDFTRDGQRYRNVCEGCTTKREAKDYERAKIAEAKQHTLITGRCEILSHLIVRFDEYLNTARTKRGEMASASKRSYRNGMRMIGQTELADMRIHKINQEQCNLHIRGAWASKANINNCIRTMRRMLSQAVEWKLLGKAPKLHGVELPGRELIYSVEQQDAMIALAPQPLKDVLKCIFGGCARPEEIYRMRIENIRWNTKTIYLPGGKTSGADREIPMTEEMELALIMRCGDRKKGWVFPCRVSKSGKPQSPSGHMTTIAKAWAKVRTELELPENAVVYSARHTALTTLMCETGNPKLVMEVGGHSDMPTAMKYQHPALEMARVAMEKRNRLRAELPTRENSAEQPPTKSPTNVSGSFGRSL